MTHPVKHQLAGYQHLRRQLETVYPEIDEETLRDTLEGATNLHAAITVIMHSYLEDLALTEALRRRIREMQERLARLDRRSESKKNLVTDVMSQADLKKVVEADFTVSLRQTAPPLIVLEESVIPEKYWKPQPPRLDRQAITAALKAGEEIRGAALGNGGLTIAVRTK